MYLSHPRRIISILAACGMTFALTTACGSDDTTDGVHYGQPEQVGEGEARTYVVVDDDGAPTEVGVRITENALTGLPDSPEGPPPVWILDLPDEASDTVFDHVSLDWASHGHEPPGLFDVPHFDVHFYMVSEDAIDAISPADPDFASKAENLPEDRYIPAGYVVPPGPPVSAQAVPNMGVHWVDSADPLVPGEYEFESTLIMGTWDGDLIFVEPMVTHEFLLQKETRTTDIPQPEAYQMSGYFPTTYTVSYDADTGEHLITLGGLEWREAS
ncbi:DUF5602 domain-containing protein [Hoyosella rhizosphaerae]|uniref:TTHB210-like domain-containing protein n=1 Tax=Hoyosella rhizosphaerae TaxID=1755582 RepID=A0A916TZU2_9ACTN|nr:DUF5602 domain-containing protein [Hoyosella rhizosphaerae]MBN4927096.1 DUF5602 domain-containing protein [Hoyosella rhizosphaerae]GGC54069.1 hypothetical protein GCM10011410_03000 [Hoyosella rhizosphaerae]